MRKIGWMAVILAGAVAGYVLGASVGKGRKPETLSQEAVGDGEKRDIPADQVPVLHARLDRVRNAIDEEDQRIGDLTAKLEEVRGKLSVPIEPEEDRRKKEEEERRKLRERRQARYEDTKGLRRKIIQRKDKALRAEGLMELTALLGSDDPEQLLLGLATVPRLRGINLDMETFVPHVFAALGHEDAEVRYEALRCVYSVCSREEQLEVMLSMLEDPSSEVRGHAISRLRWLGGTERDERIPSTLRAVLQDEDPYVRRRAVGALSDDDLREMEDLVVELTRDPEMSGFVYSLMQRRNLGTKLVHRLVEMFEEDEGDFPAVVAIHQFLPHWVSDETRPVLFDFCLRVVRDDLDAWSRSLALDALRNMGDASIIPQLEEIARGPDAEGIEDQLVAIIENLRKRASEEK